MHCKIPPTPRHCVRTKALNPYSLYSDVMLFYFPLWLRRTTCITALHPHFFLQWVIHILSFSLNPFDLELNLWNNILLELWPANTRSAINRVSTVIIWKPSRASAQGSVESIREYKIYHGNCSEEQEGRRLPWLTTDTRVKSQQVIKKIGFYFTKHLTIWILFPVTSNKLVCDNKSVARVSRNNIYQKLKAQLKTALR